MAPAARRRFTTPASSGTTEPRRLNDPAVVFMPENKIKLWGRSDSAHANLQKQLSRYYPAETVSLMTICFWRDWPLEERESHVNQISVPSVFVPYPLEQPVSMQMDSVPRRREALVLVDWLPQFVQNKPGRVSLMLRHKEQSKHSFDKWHYLDQVDTRKMTSM